MELQDLEAHWEEVTSSIEGTQLRTFPGNIDRPASIARWPDDKPFAEFLALAIALGAQPIYLDTAIFDQQALDDLRARVLDGDTLSESPPGTLAVATPVALSSFPELDRFISSARPFLDRIWAVEVQWVWASVVHSYFKVAAWYSALMDKLPELKSQFAQIEIARDAEELSRHDVELERAARSIASGTDFRTSKKTLAAIRRVAAKALPDASLSDLHQIARTALDIYETEILPVEERRLAQKARLLVNDGLSLTKAAAKLGMTTDRLQRLLARYED